MFDCEPLKKYRVEGEIEELRNIISSNSRIEIHQRDILQALSDSRINYIRTGYGETFAQAYAEAAVEGKTCRLVHINFRAEEISPRDLSAFIQSLGKDVIFGYSTDYTSHNKLKLVTVFN